MADFHIPDTEVRPRARDVGWRIGELPTGPHNGLIDVAGVRVGHTTLMSGEGALMPGNGPVRTGVTIILPHGDDLFQRKVRAAAITINGFGKPFGFEQVRELGVLEAPIALTNTLNVGLVADALVQYTIRRNPKAMSVNVVVGETNDSFLNDIQGRHVRAEHVWRAIETASADSVTEGVVGAGTGTSCFGWKGGIGTASRRLPAACDGYTVGALVQANFGRPRDLRIDGVPVGRFVTPPPERTSERTDVVDQGSVMIVLGTDAPLTARQLRRLGFRAAAGLARVGSSYGHGSGDFVIAFSTAYRVAHAPRMLTSKETVLADEGRAMRWLLPAAAESVEEAVLNALCKAQTVTGRDNHTRHALPIEPVTALIERRRPRDTAEASEDNGAQTKHSKG